MTILAGAAIVCLIGVLVWLASRAEPFDVW